MEAAIGLGQLEEADSIVKARRAAAQRIGFGLADLLRKEKLRFQLVPSDRFHPWMFFPIVTPTENKRALVQKLEAAGVETRDLLPLINQPCMQDLVKGRRFPASRWLLDHAFYVGCHQHLSADQLDHVVEVIRKHFRASRRR